MINTPNWRTNLIERHHWVTFLLPFLVYGLVTALEPSPSGGTPGFAWAYPWVYAIKIALTLAAVAFVWPGYRQFPPRLTPLALLVGIVGGPLWIALSLPNWEQTYVWPAFQHISLGSLVSLGQRPAFNPFEHFSTGGAWAFLSVRFLGLVALVPPIEEFFLRGFVMRFVTDRDWWKVPFGHATWTAIVIGTVFPMLSHPELLAAAVWFSLVTWLMLRTRNIWDCVAAHMITNLILGVYVVYTNTPAAWRLL